MKVGCLVLSLFLAHAFSVRVVFERYTDNSCATKMSNSNAYYSAPQTGVCYHTQCDRFVSFDLISATSLQQCTAPTGSMITCDTPRTCVTVNVGECVQDICNSGTYGKFVVNNAQGITYQPQPTCSATPTQVPSFYPFLDGTLMCQLFSQLQQSTTYSCAYYYLNSTGFVCSYTRIQVGTPCAQQETCQASKCAVWPLGQCLDATARGNLNLPGTIADTQIWVRNVPDNTGPGGSSGASATSLSLFWLFLTAIISIVLVF